jgi:chromatin segregation and condensation protein Rec8/ScpA/Scc1 (kleisin family)
MSDDLKNILNNSNKDIDNQKLMDYLSRQLSKQESHDLEKMMADDEFMNDAVEGLEQFSNIKKLPLSVEQLNRDLQKKLTKKKSRKEKRTIKDQPWVYYTIILLLLVTIICFVIVKKYMDNRKPVSVPKATTAQLIQ